MCGISVIVNQNNADLDIKSLVEGMNNKILHRGPDAGGTYMVDQLALGHRRLSILDLSELGNQPMEYDNLVITFNGEIFNYLELREELAAEGYTFRSQTDTEVILAAYKQWGLEAFDRFNGMWALAILDKGKNELILSRDRFGIKPLNYLMHNGVFAAGSEIKQFLDLPGFDFHLNTEVAAKFLAYGSLNYGESTFIEGVKELRGGHYLHYDLTQNSYKVHQWYNLSKKVAKSSLSYEEAVQEFRRLFESSVKLRMRSDVEVGSCLSGGIDSSSIVSIVKAATNYHEGFKTITSCYTDARYDEQQFSDEVSQATSFPAVKVYPQLNDLLWAGHLDKMIYHQDQPVASASHYNEYKVFEEARQQELIVMLDGQGSDEYLCGYPEFQETYLKELLLQGNLPELRDFLREKGNPWLLQRFKTGFHRLLEPIKTPVKRLLKKDSLQWLSKEGQNLAGQGYRYDKYNNIKELGLNEVLCSSIPYQLHSEDRNSMAFSIESRMPFMDYRLVEFGLSLPSSYKLKGGYTKSIVRDAIVELPQKIKHRKDKMGFVAPDELLIRENPERVREELINAVDLSNGLINMNIVARFDLFQQGKIRYEQIYFRVISFVRWMKIFQVKCTK